MASREKGMGRRRDLICVDMGPGQCVHMAVSECNICVQGAFCQAGGGEGEWSAVEQGAPHLRNPAPGSLRGSCEAKVQCRAAEYAQPFQCVC